ncbi:Beta-galactosidase C-terminal domain [Streptomyces sp. NPDC002838]|uniref:Beta-galactosidase C-terminal domain n=1 Tax=Streptomyces sp. NPDC002838 TaxID=3154436 RepID=UPI00331C3961
MMRTRVPLYGVLVLLFLAFLAPLLWALSGSFKPRGDIFAYPPQPIPDPFTLDNYQRLFSGQPFWRWFLMSTVVAVVATTVSVFVCALAGYGFAKFRFAGKRLLFGVMFSSLSIPFAVILVPLFVILVKTGLGSPWFALIVPWVAPAFGIFMMHQHPHFGRWPAATTHRHGTGRITYVGTVPDPAFARALLEWAAPADTWRPAHPSVTSTTATAREGRRVRFLHNWSWEPVTVPVPAAVRDVLSDATYADEVPLGAWDVKVLAEERS